MGGDIKSRKKPGAGGGPGGPDEGGEGGNELANLDPDTRSFLFSSVSDFLRGKHGDDPSVALHGITNGAVGNPPPGAEAEPQTGTPPPLGPGLPGPVAKKINPILPIAQDVGVSAGKRALTSGVSKLVQGGTLKEAGSAALKGAVKPVTQAVSTATQVAKMAKDAILQLTTKAVTQTATKAATQAATTAGVQAGTKAVGAVPVAGAIIGAAIGAGTAAAQGGGHEEIVSGADSSLGTANKDVEHLLGMRETMATPSEHIEQSANAVAPVIGGLIASAFLGKRKLGEQMAKGRAAAQMPFKNYAPGANPFQAVGQGPYQPGTS